MTLQVTVYTVEARKREDTEYPHTDFYTQDYEKAKRYAEDNRLLLIANTYEWADSELLEDYAPKDWAIVDNETGSVADRFPTEEEARADIAKCPGLYTVKRIPDTGVI